MRQWKWVGVVPGDTVCAQSARGGFADSQVFDTSTPPMGNTRLVAPGAPFNQPGPSAMSVSDLAEFEEAAAEENP